MFGTLVVQVQVLVSRRRTNNNLERVFYWNWHLGLWAVNLIKSHNKLCKSWELEKPSPEEANKWHLATICTRLCIRVWISFKRPASWAAKSNHWLCSVIDISFSANASTDFVSSSSYPTRATLLQEKGDLRLAMQPQHCRIDCICQMWNCFGA